MNSIWRKVPSGGRQVHAVRLGFAALAVIDIGRRAGGIADHQGPIPRTAAAHGEVIEVGLAPAVGDQHVVGPQGLPEVQIAVLAEVAHGGQEEGQAGR